MMSKKEFIPDDEYMTTLDEPVLSLNESFKPSDINTLNEAEVPFTLNSKEMFGSADTFDLKKAAQKRVSDENERIAKEAEEKRKAELKEKNKDLFAIIDSNESAKDILEKIFDEYVPASGKSDIVAVELARAYAKISGRWYNDGDVLFIGYGIETCGRPFNYIAYTLDSDVFSIVDNFSKEMSNNSYTADEVYEYADEHYEDVLDDIANAIVTWMRNNPGACLWETDDMLDKKYNDNSDLEELEPKFSLEVSSSNFEHEIFDWVYEYGDNVGYDMRDLIRDFSDDAEWWDSMRGAEKDYEYADVIGYLVPVESYNDAVKETISWFDDKLSELKNEYGETPGVDEEEEEDMDESLTNKNESSAKRKTLGESKTSKSSHYDCCGVDIDLEELRETASKYYSILYNNDDIIHGGAAGDYSTSGLSGGFDDYVESNSAFKKLVQEYVKYVGDFISSDREAAAFIFAVDVLHSEIWDAIDSCTVNESLSKQEENEIIDELTRMIQNGKTSCEAWDIDTKNLVMSYLRRLGYKFEVSGNDRAGRNSYHIEWWKDSKKNESLDKERDAYNYVISALESADDVDSLEKAIKGVFKHFGGGVRTEKGKHSVTADGWVPCRGKRNDKYTLYNGIDVGSEGDMHSFAEDIAMAVHSDGNENREYTYTPDLGKAIRNEAVEPKRKTAVTHYSNKRNPNKRLEVHDDGYGHRSMKQYMQWDEGEELDFGKDGKFTMEKTVRNDLGDRRLHRWRKPNYNEIMQDYDKMGESLDESRISNPDTYEKVQQIAFDILEKTYEADFNGAIDKFDEYKSLASKVRLESVNKKNGSAVNEAKNTSDDEPKPGTQNDSDFEGESSPIEKLKKGDYFTVKNIQYPRESQVYVFDGYSREEKKYCAYKFTDINKERYFKKGTVVYTGMTF